MFDSSKFKGFKVQGFNSFTFLGFVGFARFKFQCLTAFLVSSSTFKSSKVQGADASFLLSRGALRPYNVSVYMAAPFLSLMGYARFKFLG